MRWLLPVLALPGCLDFDWAVWNGIPCDTVSAGTCDRPDPWDDVCDRCATPYDFTRDYDWYASTLRPGERVRPALDVQQLAFPTTDGLGTLDAWYVPAHGEVPELADTLVVYSHGNYASIEPYLPRLRFLHEAGYAVLAWDYRGYGKSLPDTTATPEQLMADARLVRDEAEALATDPSRILVYGYSIGSIAAVEMATTTPGCALVLESPFPGFSEVGRAATTLGMPEGFFSSGHYDNVGKLDGFADPLFLMAGEDDQLFPPASVAPLLDGAVGPTARWFLPGVRHGIGQGGGVPEAGFTRYAARLRGFLDTHAPGCVGAR